jgi:hypothetical protein
MIVALALGCAGCGGISGSQSISPASFLLPGLLRADPPQTNAPVGPNEIPTQLASVR